MATVSEDLDGDTALQDQKQLVGVRVQFPVGVRHPVAVEHAEGGTVERCEFPELEWGEISGDGDGVVTVHDPTVPCLTRTCLVRMFLLFPGPHRRCRLPPTQGHPPASSGSFR